MTTGQDERSEEGRGAEDQAGRKSARLGPRRRWAVALGTAGVLLAAAVLTWSVRRLVSPSPALPPSGAAAPDPRRDYAGPFRNVDPAVRYVAEDRCARCHEDKARAFAEHPMGRSLLPVAQARTPPLDPGHGNPFEALGAQFRIERPLPDPPPAAGESRVGGLRHRRTQLDPNGRPAAELAWDVHYAIGSGVVGYSYLTERDGYLYQTPVSWYEQQKQAWGLSPGFGPALLTGRPVPPECLFCHANRANYVEGSVNRYAEPVFDGHAIGCQRCHGPGELHVAARDRLEPIPDQVDYTIVNPRHLERSLREAVCEQCHLEAEVRVLSRGRGLYDFRPGLPLELFWSAFVRAPEAGKDRKAVGHVEQMVQSRCFQGSRGTERLGCVSCHDPHERVPPARRVAHYRSRCLQCHEQQGCSLPLADRLRRTAEDSCIDCHMPRYGTSDIPHTASTDHRILKNAERDGEAAPRAPGPGLRVGDGMPVVSFYRGPDGAGGREEERDLGVALVRLARHGNGGAARNLDRALSGLTAAWQRDPEDLAAGESTGDALALEDRWVQALAAFEAVLARAPDRETALVGAASAAEALGQAEAALGYWRRAVTANPWMPDYRRHVALLLVRQQAWYQARAESEAWVRLDPMSAEARSARLACLLGVGNQEEARAEFARIEALAPDNLAELRARFGQRLK